MDVTTIGTGNIISVIYVKARPLAVATTRSRLSVIKTSRAFFWRDASPTAIVALANVVDHRRIIPMYY